MTPHAAQAEPEIPPLPPELAAIIEALAERQARADYAAAQQRETRA